MSLAIAIAVVLWSPVIITVFIPEFLAFLTASYTSSLGGSIIAIRPINVNSFSSSIEGLKLSSTFLVANANTLNALLEKYSLICLYSLNISSSSSTTSPLLKAYLHLLKITSGAPLVNIIVSSSILFTVDINFLSLSKGISPTLIYFSLNVL